MISEEKLPWNWCVGVDKTEPAEFIIEDEDWVSPSTWATSGGPAEVPESQPPVAAGSGIDASQTRVSRAQGATHDMPVLPGGQVVMPASAPLPTSSDTPLAGVLADEPSLEQSHISGAECSEDTWFYQCR